MIKYKGSTMNKIAIVILLIVIIIVSTIGYIAFSFNNQKNMADRKNMEFSNYFDKKITGAEVATMINKAMNSNAENQVEKDEKDNYKDNNKNSINIDIKFIDNDKTYRMEAIYKNGTDTFMQYYNSINFKCMDVKYHESTGQIQCIYIEQAAD